MEVGAPGTTWTMGQLLLVSLRTWETSRFVVTSYRMNWFGCLVSANPSGASRVLTTRGPIVRKTRLYWFVILLPTAAP